MGVLQGRILRGTRIVLPLLVIAVITMAVGRYV